MKENYRKYIPVVRVIVSCLPVVIGFSLFFLVPSSRDGTQVWKGYYTLLVDRSHNSELIQERLEKNGIPDPVSYVSATVGYNDFGNQRVLPLSEVPDRFDPADPRFDKFMKRLPALFMARDGDREFHVFYLPFEGNPVELYRTLSKALSQWRNDWVVLEWDPTEGAVYLTAFLLLLGMITARSRWNRLFAAVSGLPAGIPVFFGDMYSFMTASILYIAWMYCFDELYPYMIARIGSPERGLENSTVVQRFLYAGIVTIATVFFVFRFGAGAAGVVPVGALLLSFFGCTAVAAAIALIRREDREHTLFVPVSILPRRFSSPLAKGYRVLYPWILLVLVAPIIAVFFLPGPKNLPSSPRPVPVAGVYSFSVESIERLSAVRTATDLPDIGEYLQHRARQDSFMNARFGAAVGLGEDVAVSRFLYSDTGVSRSQETLHRFDQGWVEHELEKTAPGTVGELLSSTDTPVLVRFGPPPRVVPDPVHLYQNLFFAFVMLSPFPVWALVSRRTWGLAMPVGVFRKRKTEA
jgi:hypothetical protein